MTALLIGTLVVLIPHTAKNLAMVTALHEVAGSTDADANEDGAAEDLTEVPRFLHFCPDS